MTAFEELPPRAAKKRFQAQMLINLFAGIRPLQPGEMILDLGCGDGSMLETLRENGLDVRGCDFSKRLEPRSHRTHVVPIETDPFHLPFPDRSFDVLYSWQVLEHVLDLARVLEENRRILKPGGIALHIFSGRYSLMEPHVRVPLATMVRARWWLGLWAVLGIRSEHQAGKGAREVARLNFAYLASQTRYPRRATILRQARRAFPAAEFREDLFIDLGTSRRSKIVQRIAAMSPVLRRLIGRIFLVRMSQTRVLVLK